MSEHLTEQIIDLYRRREMGPAERERTDAHLATCEVCLAHVADPEQSALAFNALTEALLPTIAEQPFHLTPAELRAYASGEAGGTGEAERVICESHLEICAQCSDERRLLSTVPVRDPADANSDLHKWWPAVSFTPARMVAAIVLLGIVVFAIVVWRQRSSTRNEAARIAPAATPLVPSSPGPTNETVPKPEEQRLLVRILDNNREVRLDQNGQLVGLEELDGSTQRLARAALAGESQAKPRVLNELRSPPIKFLGAPPGEGSFELFSPIGKVISEQSPALSWQKLAGATGYVVSIFDANFNRVAQSPKLSTPAWTLSQPLQRGQTYSWEVTAFQGDKEITAPIAPAPRAQFRIIETDQLSVLTKLKGQQPASHLALGLMYARFGLLDDAEREFRQLVKDNPDSELPKKLLRTVQAWRN